MDQYDREKGKSGMGGAQGADNPGMSEYSAGNMNREYAASRTGTSGTGAPGTGQTKEVSQQVAEQAKETATQVAGQAAERAKSMIDEQKGRAVDTLAGVAGALRQTGHQLYGQDQTQFGEYADKIADQIDRFSTTLRDRSAEDLLREAESFARREPQLFLGGAVVLGLLAARFFKSSAPRNRQLAYPAYSDYERGRYYGSGYAGSTYGGPGYEQRYGGQGYTGQRYGGQGYSSQTSTGSGAARIYPGDIDEPGTSESKPKGDFGPEGSR